MACARKLPSLFQMSVEKVASEIARYKPMIKYLKRMQLPEVYIYFLENNFSYTTCDFITYIDNIEKTNILPVVPSEPIWQDNCKYKITVGSERVMYMSTIFDLGVDMLKLDLPEGEYELVEFYDGYVLSTKDYTPAIRDTVHVFNSGRDKGFAGPYPQRCVENLDHLRILKQFINKYMRRRWWDTIARYIGEKMMDEWPDRYMNFPIFFYLTEHINIDDLSKISLTCPTRINTIGHVQVCWYVFHSLKGRIGICLLQEDIYTMMSQNVGVGLLVSNGFRAVGNFDYNFDIEYDYLTLEDEEFEIAPDHVYECEFNPCNCDYKPNEVNE